MNISVYNQNLSTNVTRTICSPPDEPYRHTPYYNNDTVLRIEMVDPSTLLDLQLYFPIQSSFFYISSDFVWLVLRMRSI